MTETRGKQRDWMRWSGDGVLTCEHCGARYAMNLPAPITIVQAIVREWSTLHQKCKPA